MKMSARRIWINPILFSTWLNETYTKTVDWQQGVIDEYDRIVMAPLASAKLGVLPRGNSFDRLQACARLVEEELAKVCRRQDVDVWLSYIRRLPAIIHGWEDDWVTVATLAIIKYAQWSVITSGGASKVRDVAMVGIPSSADLIEDVAKIALLSRQMALINNTCRWIGKGAEIEHLGGGQYKRIIPAELNDAVMSYERRRPTTPPWHEIGIVPVEAHHDGDSYVFQGVGVLRREVMVRRLELSTPTAYAPLFCPAAELADVLDPYKKAIGEKYNLTLSAVMHTLVTMTRLLAGRFPEHVADTMFEFDQDPDDIRFAGSLAVFLSVVQRGLMWLPEDYFRKLLSSEPCPPWSNTAEEAASSVEAFFREFALDASRRDEIDVVLRHPFHQFLFTSLSGVCYVDLLAMTEFYRTLVLGAREWAGTGHGDDFTMDVRRLARRIPGVKALPKIANLKYPSGRDGEIDVPLIVGRRLYAIECKAYSKSAAFMAGDPVATNNRTQEIKGWVEQAKKAATASEAQRTTVTPKVPDEVTEIEWIVCTSGQEFVCPENKFGALGTLPRVCTVAELLEHLRDEAAKLGG